MVQQLFAFSLAALSIGLPYCGAAEPFKPVQCEGAYAKHLQGICTNDTDAIYWSFTTTLVKTDTNGHVVAKVPVADHHGDLCFHDGRVYVAVNLGEFNQPPGKADSWVYAYDGATLREVARHRVAELVHGAGGIAFRGGRFFVVGGLPAGAKENYVYEYDSAFEFQQCHVVNSGYTLKGIQTVANSGDDFWFGCYGIPKVLIRADQKFQVLGKWNLDGSLGLAYLPNKQFLVARGAFELGKGYRGRVVLAEVDEKAGLKLSE